MVTTFYFDFLSPYSYLAWCWLRENHEELREKGKLALKPVTLAPIIKANETKGPAEIPSKRNFLMKDCLRFTTLHDIPFRAPASLPFNSLYALRISLVECSGLDQLKVIDTFYRGAWEHGLDLGNAETIESILNEAGFPGSKWLDRVGDRDLRQMLKSNTSEAIQSGIFGLPTFLVDNGEGQEIFWGNDSIPYLRLYLEGKDPLNQNEYKLFQNAYLEL